MVDMADRRALDAVASSSTPTLSIHTPSKIVRLRFLRGTILPPEWMRSQVLNCIP